MSEERLYQPDFSCIFGKEFSNAFLYGQVDSLVWPIFTDLEQSDTLKNLLKLKNNDGREYFYHRKISLDDEKIELNCSNIDLALIQALELGREYGIPNSDVVAAVKKEPNLFRAVLSFNISQIADSLSELKGLEKEVNVAGIVFYPSYTKTELTTDNRPFEEFLEYCKSKSYFIKIDVGNLMFPEPRFGEDFLKSW